jgi:hypothetical protein
MFKFKNLFKKQDTVATIVSVAHNNIVLERGELPFQTNSEITIFYNGRYYFRTIKNFKFPNHVASPISVKLSEWTAL